MEWNSPAEAQRFVADYANPILRLCLTYSLTREDAQDICQEIFLKLLEQNRTFADREHEKAYILRMAINACKNLLKSAGRRRTSFIMRDTAWTRLPSCAPAPRRRPGNG